MALTYSSSDFGTLIIPGAYTRLNVQTPASGIGVAGILALIGEADEGLATSAATEDLSLNYYTPSQMGDVINKYTSGPLVEAFKAAVAPANDPNLPGSVTRIYLYKTNPSTIASSAIPTISTTYGTLSALKAGANGSNLKWETSVYTNAIAPTTGTFSYIPVPSAATSAILNYRIRGGANTSLTINPNIPPNTLVSTLTSGSLLATGGVNRSAFAGLATINVTTVAAGNSATFTLAAGSVFATTPVPGDLLVLPANTLYGATADSTFAGAGSANLGTYVVTSVSNTTLSAFITATKVADHVNATVTAPVSVVATPFSATVTNDMQVYSPMSITDKSGTNRSSFAALASAGVSVTASGANLRLNLTGATAFAQGANAPRVGDIFYIPSGSSISGAGNANVGYYTVSTVNNVTSSAYCIAARLSNGSPVNVAATTFSATPDNDARVSRPWIDGIQLGFELSDGGGTRNVNQVFYDLGTTTAATWISTASIPYFVAGTDYQANLLISRSTDNLQESYTAIGGNIALKLSYVGTTATVTVTGTSLSTSVTGGSGANLTLNFSNYPTLSDLVGYINSQTGYTAAVATASVGQLSPTILDQGVYSCATSTAGTLYPCRIKKDLYDFKTKLALSSNVSFTSIAVAGLPESSLMPTFFAGGAKTGTSGAAVIAAIDKLADIDCNFIVPLFSRDASLDIVDGLTDVSSTYTIDAINAYTKSNVLAMSQIKMRKNRLAVLSYRNTYANCKIQAQNLASAKVALAIQDVKAVGISGNIVQFQPWYAAAVAASMQAIGLYKSIMHKYTNISGIITPFNDFNPRNNGQLEDAILSGLLILENPPTGGFRWVSDQTTYGKDNNFVFNSLQVMYTADFMALDLLQSFDNFAVGQAISDISAANALVFLKYKMDQYLKNSLISPSDGAPAGFDAASVQISGPVMRVNVNVYITNAIAFVPITLNVSQVTQTA